MILLQIIRFIIFFAKTGSIWTRHGSSFFDHRERFRIWNTLAPSFVAIFLMGMNFSVVYLANYTFIGHMSFEGGLSLFIITTMQMEAVFFQN